MKVFNYLLLLVICQCISYSALAAKKTTLSILPFASLKGEQLAWLGKGLADMLMRNLSEVNDLAILERNELQTFLNEMELGQSAFVKKSEVIRVGQVAKLNQVIYGNYTLLKNNMAMNKPQVTQSNY